MYAVVSQHSKFLSIVCMQPLHQAGHTGKDRRSLVRWCAYSELILLLGCLTAARIVGVNVVALTSCVPVCRKCGSITKASSAERPV